MTEEGEPPSAPPPPFSPYRRPIEQHHLYVSMADGFRMPESHQPLSTNYAKPKRKEDLVRIQERHLMECLHRVTVRFRL